MKLFILVFFFCLVALSQEIKVMVVDTGLDASVKKIKPYLAENNPKDLIDTHGHGTHVTGTVLFGPKLNTPVCKQVKLYVCRFYYPGSMTDSYDCFERATKLNIQFVNFSAGGPDYQQEEYVALKTMLKKTILIAAIGNNYSDVKKTPYYPASLKLDNIIAVGNGVSEFRRHKSSNYGKSGMLWRYGINIESFYLNGTTVKMTGSSQSTAIVTHELLQQACKKLEKK